jgi:hypothetical protein
MTAWLVRFERRWLAPATPARLGVGRALFFGLIFLRHAAAPPDMAFWAGVPAIFRSPAPILGVLTLPIAPALLLAWLDALWLASLAAAALGLATRLSTAAAFLLGAYLLWIPHSFGKLHHGDSALILALAVLACSRCGDAFSLDRLLARRRGAPEPPPSGDYAWPVRTLRLLVALVFIEAGLSKLLIGGLAWITSDNLSLMLQKASYRAYTGVAPISDLGLVLAQHKALCRWLAAGVVALEVSYPLALFGRRLAAVLVPLGFLSLLGFFIFVVPAFYELLCCHVFWLPLRTASSRLESNQ